MPNIEKVIDRVRKLLSLKDNTTSEAEAAEAASQASRLMEQFQLSEAMVRLQDSTAKPEPIVKERLEPDKVVANSKRVAWKETIASAVARDLGVKMYWMNTHVGGRMRADVRGMGRESAVQAWRYTWQYLCRAVDELAEQAWESHQFKGDAYESSARAWKNAFRVGAASRLAVRIHEAKKAREQELQRKVREVQAETPPERDSQESLALVVIEKDQAEVDREYSNMAKGWKTMSSVGQITSSDGFSAGQRAGDKISLGGGRAGLASGQGSLTDG